jgi:hypothetical protein
MQSEPEHHGNESVNPVADQWTWKRFLIAIGFGFVIPVFMAVTALHP